MLSTQQFENCFNFSQELELKRLVQSNRVSIIYIHGTARSGSTIAEIVLSQLADLAIHQPFRGVLQHAGEHFRIAKIDLNAHIYNSACGLIVKQINQYLQNKQKIVVTIKELADFFHPYIWQRWLEIPDKFLFTIREPHIQYMSWLSAMTDKVFQGGGKLQENLDFVTGKANITETSFLSAEWEGTTLSCNQAAWKALVEDFNQVKKLDLLYAPEQVYLPTLSELKENQNPGLIATHPFMAYAIAMFNFQRQKKPISFDRVSSWLKSVIRNKPKQTAADLGSFNSSFAAINSYWNL